MLEEKYYKKDEQVKEIKHMEVRGEITTLK